MTTPEELFIDLRARLFKTIDTMSDEERYGKDQKMRMIKDTLAHLENLIGEAKRPLNKRHYGLIESGWASVLKVGKAFELFKKYEGNEVLRENLRKFLKGEV